MQPLISDVVLKRSFGVLSFLGAMLMACPHRVVSLPAQSDVRTTTELRGRVEAATDWVRSLRGEAKLKLDSPRGKGTVSVFLAVSETGQVHIEALDFFGRPHAIFVSDGTNFGLHQVDEGKYYSGPATPENLTLFLPLAVPVSDLIAFLRGDCPRMNVEPREFRYHADSATYVMDARVAESWEKWTVNARHFRLTRCEVGGSTEWVAAFEDFKPESGGAFPRRMQLKIPRARTIVDLSYQMLEFNPPNDEALFGLVPPTGVMPIMLDENGHLRANSEATPSLN